MHNILDSLFAWKLYTTNFCIEFQITLKFMRGQCHGQRQSLTVQLNSKSVRRTDLYTKVCTDLDLRENPVNYC